MSIDTDLLSAAIGFLLTVMVFSYLIKDNAAFRVAVYIFVGVASGYAATVVFYDVLVPKLANLLQAGGVQIILTAMPLLLGVTLLAKFFPRTSWMGSFAMALLVGVGTATAIGGALVGTLVPQFQAATGSFDLLSMGGGLSEKVVSLAGSGVMLLGTILTLAAFHFSAGRAADGTPRRNRIIELLAWGGRFFIAITLGALFAGVYMAALTAMIERLHFLIIDFPSVIGQLLTGS